MDAVLKKIDNIKVIEKSNLGALGTIFTVWDSRRSEELSLKLIERGLLKRFGSEKDFEQEVKNVIRVQHPNIIRVYGVEEIDEYLYLIMELIEGETLREILNRKKRLSIDEVISILVQAASALHYIHAHGLIHGDLKPDNIIINENRDVKIIAFGLIGSEALGKNVSPFKLLDNPAYLAPEQASNEQQILTYSIDLYALGVIVYEMLTGRLPQYDYDESIIPSSVDSSVNPYVVKVLEKALAKNPLDRFPEVFSFVKALKEASTVGRKTTIVFTDEGDTESIHLVLTPDVIKLLISPYLESLSGIQNIYDEVNGHSPNYIRIISLTQNSPISATVEGIANAAQVVQEIIVPWRRRHAKLMAVLLEQEKQITIEKTKGEILEVHARASKERAEKEKLIAEVALQNAKVEKMRLENEAERLKLQKEKIQLAVSVLKQISSSLPEDVKMVYVVRLLPLLDTIITSPFEISMENQ